MATVVLSVVGGLVALLLAYQLKKMDDLATVMSARYDSLSTAMHTGFLDLTKAHAGTDIRVAALEHQMVTTTQRFDQRFDGVDQRFDGVDQRLDRVDQRFDRVDQRFDGVDQRFDGVDQRFDGVDQRFDGVDQRFDGVDQRFDGVDQRFDGVDQRFDGVDQRFDGVDQRLESLGRGLGDVATLLQEVDEKIDLHLAAPHRS